MQGKTISTDLIPELSSEIRHLVIDSCLKIEEDRNEFVARLKDGVIKSEFIVVATGAITRDKGLAESKRIIIGPYQKAFCADFHGKDVVVLGGGDNAFEYASIALERKAAAAHIYHRSIRASTELKSRAIAVGAELVRAPSPEVVERQDGVYVDGRRFDICLVMYGFEPYIPEGALEITGYPNVFVIGDASGGIMSIQNSISDGKSCAQTICNKNR